MGHINAHAGACIPIAGPTMQASATRNFNEPTRHGGLRQTPWPHEALPRTPQMNGAVVAPVDVHCLPCSGLEGLARCNLNGVVLYGRKTAPAEGGKRTACASLCEMSRSTSLELFKVGQVQLASLLRSTRRHPLTHCVSFWMYAPLPGGSTQNTKGLEDEAPTSTPLGAVDVFRELLSGASATRPGRGAVPFTRLRAGRGLDAQYTPLHWRIVCTATSRRQAATRCLAQGRPRRRTWRMTFPPKNGRLISQLEGALMTLMCAPEVLVG
jgi:hypothetical protein